MLKTLYKNKYLFVQLVKKDFLQRYKGSVLGFVWMLLVPILMLCIYTFVFSVVFQAKWNIDTSDRYQFAMSLFCGLSVFNVFGEVLNRSTNLIAANTNYVKKVIFPLELLPLMTDCTAALNCVINLCILIVAKLIVYHEVSDTLWLLIPILAPVFVFSLGIGLAFSAMSVFLKDLGSIISVIVTILMYATPVFYSIESVPQSLRFYFYFNPLSYMLENARSVILNGRFPDWGTFLLSIVVSIVVYYVGKTIFDRSREGFADVL